MAFDADTALSYLRAAHEGGRLGHAYLVTGGSSAAQESLAAQLVTLVNGGEIESLDDIREAGGFVVRPESKSRRIKVEQIREMERGLHLGGVSGGRMRIAIIGEADRLQPASENAFLKTLEEPPRDTLILLLTLEPERLLETILSRCIRIPLKDEPAARSLTEDAAALLDTLAEQGTEVGSVGVALALKHRFAEILRGAKDRIESEYGAAFKEEVARYKQATDGKWLEQREKYYEALSQSASLGVRSSLLGILASWLGDALRHKAGRAEALDFPDRADRTAALAAGVDEADLIRRIDAVSQLRAHLETNVQEALALEVCFLKIFA